MAFFFADMSSTAFIEPGRVLNFVEKAIGRRITNAITVGYFLNNYGNEVCNPNAFPHDLFAWS
jgi:hypothetical protein